jgi:hypothetical protein
MNKTLITLIVAFATLTSYAADPSNEVQSQDWVWSLSPIDGYYYAGTTNSAGNFLALYCYTDIPGDANCVYGAQLGSTCKKDETHNTIVNAGAGANSVILTCTSDENTFVIAPFETMTAAVRDTSTLILKTGTK